MGNHYTTMSALNDLFGYQQEEREKKPSPLEVFLTSGEVQQQCRLRLSPELGLSGSDPRRQLLPKARPQRGPSYQS